MKKKPTNYALPLIVGIIAFCVIASYPRCLKSKPTAKMGILEAYDANKPDFSKECPYEYGECPSPECVNHLPKHNSNICPECQKENCIYQQIDKVYDQSDMDLGRAILLVCGERGIKDSVTIDLIKANYNL